MATVSEKLLTWKEFAALPEPRDGSRRELVRGAIIIMVLPGFRHGKVQGRIVSILDQFARPRRLGQVLGETGVITERDPDSVRGPDVVYWSAARLPLDAEPEVWADVPPDLCVEVRSPDESGPKMKNKADEYLAAGVGVVWYVDPTARTVTIYRPGQPARVVAADDTLTGEDVLPGFACPVADFFN